MIISSEPCLFLPQQIDAGQKCREILEYIAENETWIKEQLAELDDEEITYPTLRQYFGEFTLPVVRFFGHITSAQRIAREVRGDKPFWSIDVSKLAGVLADPGLSPLEILLLREEMGEEAE